MWMNEYDVQNALRMIEMRRPEYKPYADYLAQWIEIVNDNSDGWPYWKAAGQSAKKLMDLLQIVVGSIRRGTSEGLPDEQEFKRALAPIKSLATRKNLPAPVLRKNASSMNVEERLKRIASKLDHYASKMVKNPNPKGRSSHE